MRMVYDDEAANMLASVFELVAKKIRNKEIREEFDLGMAFAVIGWASEQFESHAAKSAIENIYDIARDTGDDESIIEFLEAELPEVAEIARSSFQDRDMAAEIRAAAKAARSN